jgi:hypothetical protein
MSRSRSSFDIGGAIATATALTPEPRAPGDVRYAGVPLVSFERPPAAPPEPASAPEPAREPAPVTTEVDDARPTPPKLPDLTGVVSPTQRCERIVGWIIEATGATEVFMADAAGLPLAGTVDAEAQIATAGIVAHAALSLAAARPGSSSRLFEMHVGDGPFLQLIGFEVGAAVYLVGLTRATPLTPRQAHAIRLACRHALGDTLGGAS